MNQILRNFESTDCRRLRPLLDDFIAEELSVETNQSILVHLEICRACRQEKDSRVQTRRRLRSAWNDQQATRDLEAGIRQAVQPNWLPVRLAAGLMVPLLAVLIYSQFGGQPSLTVVDHLRDIAQDHVHCQGEPAPDQTEPLDVQAVGLESILSQHGDFYLVAVQDCDSGEAHFKHYIFEGARGRVSVVIEERDSYQVLPNRPGEIRRMLAGLEIRASQLLGVHQTSVAVASMEIGTHFVYLIADDYDQRETLSLTELVLPALKQAL